MSGDRRFACAWSVWSRRERDVGVHLFEVEVLALEPPVFFGNVLVLALLRGRDGDLGRDRRRAHDDVLGRAHRGAGMLAH